MDRFRHKFLPRVVVYSVVCLLVCSAVHSQERTSLERVPVIVRDRHGLVIQGITVQDLAAKVGGNSASVAAITVDSRPHRVVILLDTSSSMAGVRNSKSWKLPVNIATYAASSVSPNMELAFLAFDETAHHVIDFAQGNAAVLDQLNRISAAEALSEIGIRKRTALYDAIYRGLQLIDKPSSADMLLVVSDGGDNMSSLTPEALERILTRSGVRFFAVRTQDFDDPYLPRYLDYSGGPHVLAKIAEKTGGEVFGPVGFRSGAVNFAFSSYDYSDKTSLNDALSWFLQGMTQHEAAEIQLSSTSETGQPLELRLSNTATHRWKGATLTYPRKLFPHGSSVKPASTSSR